MILTQDEADALIEMVKWIEENALPVEIPPRGKSHEYKTLCDRPNTSFKISITRSTIAGKCTFQGRLNSPNQVLIRIDICNKNKGHRNPGASEEIRGSHIHFYKEGYGDKFAVPYKPNSDSLTEICRDFFRKFCIIETQVVEQITMEV